MELKIVVYSKSACPQCDSVKMLLKTRALGFDEIKIDDETQRLAFYEKCGPGAAERLALRGVALHERSRRAKSRCLAER